MSTCLEDVITAFHEAPSSFSDRLAENHFLSVARAYLDSLLVPWALTRLLVRDEPNTATNLSVA